MRDTALDQLATLYGIELEYWDIWGKRHVVSVETKCALLKAMGVSIENESEAAAALAEHERISQGQFLDPVHVIRENEPPIRIPVRLSVPSLENALEWTLIEESGERHEGTFVPADLAAAVPMKEDPIVECVLELTVMPKLGYHWLEIRELDDRRDPSPALGKTRLIVTPTSCYMPSGLQQKERIWGPAIQLYATSSGRNWGIGDFTDLKTVLNWCADVGAGVIGLNPLNSLFTIQPQHASPYSPSSRLFLNYLYIDVEAIADFHECEEAKRTVQNPEFQARLTAIRETELVDYEQVAAIKRPILEMLFQHFQEHHLKPETGRGRAFHAFQVSGGENFEAFGVFETLQEHFHEKKPTAWGWQKWPEPYRNPQSKAVAEFAASHQGRVEFFQYLQWQADLQLGGVGRQAMDAGLKMGVYQDLPVSVDPAGFETWFCQDLYALQARIGAPPDDFNLKGQNWGLPPVIPRKLAEATYEPFIAVLRSNMRYAGAIRIDHVMQLMRLFWVPPGQPPSEGTYVRYPFQHLLGILALESQRGQCLVVGEDLGTVPDEVREELRSLGVLSYRLLYFEKEEDDSFKRPSRYPEQALVAVSTHDLPTLHGYWQGHDLTIKEELGLFPSEELREAQLVARFEDRIRLLFALAREGLLPKGIDVDAASLPEMSPPLVTATYRYLAQSPAKVLTFQLEDVLGQREQVNLPGTTIEYPNWKRKVPKLLETFWEDEHLESLVATLRLERGTGIIPHRKKDEEEATVPVSPLIPIATYRLQLNKHLGFSEAAGIVPYLRQLGISHCYVSPCLKARPGSSHGYDIVDHTRLNSELGSNEDFEHLVATLHQHGMGQILDIVPNHMAVGSDNPWWVDVLENGQASLYGTFFDIAWHPLKDELRGKVLLPILEDHYGKVLEEGLLRLTFDGQSGNFSLGYHEHCFPIDPVTYAVILAHGLTRLETRLGDDDSRLPDFQSLIAAFENIPQHWQTEEENASARIRDKEVHKRRLARLCRECHEIQEFIEQNVAVFNGVAGQPESFDALHSLLQSQAYRLAYWRVASDDINYRRFFDINELAGLRMEIHDVFRETHQFALSLIAERKIQGLRIDHIDGLYDPAQYCHWLREGVEKIVSLQPELVNKGAISGATSSPDDSLYMVVEKILASYEQLPAGWPVQGTTGYDFASLVGGLFVDSANERKMDRIYTHFLGAETDFDELLYKCKKLIMKVAMASELNVLANELSHIAESYRHTRDFTVNRLGDALMEMVAYFPVYRTYVSGENVTAEDRRYVEWAVARSQKNSPAADISVYDFIRDVLLVDIGQDKDGAYRKAVIEFAMSLQQFTGPVMAKGLEDTSLYRYNRLISLNEVGGDPRRFGVSVSAFHNNNKYRAAQWPHTMLNTSTHDSKRSEDVRARISVLSEVPDEWQRLIRRWSRLNRSKKQKLDTTPAPSKNDEYALYQILIGVWPLQNGEDEHATMIRFSERIEAYIIKAIREAKSYSSWINPNSQYEDAVIAFVRALLNSRKSNTFLQEFLPFQRQISRLGMLNSLSQLLLKLTAPGVPDIYQGNELWNFCLVDPDNRNLVDFKKRADMLQQLQSLVSVPEERLVEKARELLDTMEDGRIKLYVTWKTLSVRWDYEKVFRDGAYLPLSAHGPKAEYVCAFARKDEHSHAIVVAPRLYANLCGLESGTNPLGRDVWSDTWLELPFSLTWGGYRNVFTGESLKVNTRADKAAMLAADLFRSFPVALLTST